MHRLERREQPLGDSRRRHARKPNPTIYAHRHLFQARTENIHHQHSRFPSHDVLPAKVTRFRKASRRAAMHAFTNVVLSSQQTLSIHLHPARRHVLNLHRHRLTSRRVFPFENLPVRPLTDRRRSFSRRELALQCGYGILQPQFLRLDRPNLVIWRVLCLHALQLILRRGVRDSLPVQRRSKRVDATRASLSVHALHLFKVSVSDEPARFSRAHNRVKRLDDVRVFSPTRARRRRSRRVRSHVQTVALRDCRD